LGHSACGKGWTGSAAYVDAVLGSTLIAAACLAILQFALLKLHGDCSAYAVKKHMFIVVTLGIVNAVRVITGYFPESKGKLPSGIAPFDARAISWQRGADLKDGTQYAMVLRTPEIDQKCSERFAESRVHMTTEPSCLKQ